MWILRGPLGAVEADESVVGLMGLHVLAGEFPAFYWGQPYLGSLEAYLVAGLFALVGPSNLALKTVPALAYLAFVLLVYVGARRDLGPRVALAATAYLALPPSFLAFWSLKARGGYVELLALGQLLLMLAPRLGQPGRRLAWRLALLGLLAGVVVWIHVLGLVYALPVGLYLGWRLGRARRWGALAAGAVGGLVGLAPALIDNLSNDWETLYALGAGGSTAQTFQDNLAALAQVGLPVLVGLGQATSSPTLFAESWPRQPASWEWIPPLLMLALGVCLVPAIARVQASLAGRACLPATLGFGLAVALLTPPLVALGRFGELVAEPRYALPLYAAVPIVVWCGGSWLDRRARLGGVILCALLAANVLGVVMADPRLNLPTSAAGSDEANRAELGAWLEGRGLTEIYTDYWLAYPLIFESQERIAASVSSGGYNRFAPYAYFVAVSDRPAYVFIRDSDQERAFVRRLTELRGRAAASDVSIYRIYERLEPLDLLRP